MPRDMKYQTVLNGRLRFPNFGFWTSKFKNSISSSMLLVLIQNFLYFQETGIYIKKFWTLIRVANFVSIAFLTTSLADFSPK